MKFIPLGTAFLIGCCLYSCSPNVSSLPAKSQRVRFRDTIGIKVTRSEFDSLLSYSLKKLHANEVMSAADYVVLVRLFNTINQLELRTEQAWEIVSVYGDAILDGAVAVLHARESGSSLYSPDYDISIGGLYHANSMYTITK